MDIGVGDVALWNQAASVCAMQFDMNVGLKLYSKI